MVKVFTYKCIASLIALLLFISSSGLTLDVHYCGDQIYDYTFLGIAESCQADMNADNEQPLQFKSDGCCGFGKYKIETDNDYNPSSFDLDVKQELSDFILPTFDYNLKVSPQKSVHNTVLKYKPPLIERDILILFQSFRIWFINVYR